MKKTIPSRLNRRKLDPAAVMATALALRGVLSATGAGPSAAERRTLRDLQRQQASR